MKSSEERQLQKCNPLLQNELIPEDLASGEGLGNLPRAVKSSRAWRFDPDRAGPGFVGVSGIFPVTRKLSGESGSR